MGCNAWNHPASCNCGWGGDTGGRGGLSAWTVPTMPAADGSLWSAGRRPAIESFVNPNAHCPVCGAAVYFYQSPYGGRVFFDDLGPPWPKHPCTDNGSPPRARVPAVSFPAPTVQWIRDGWRPATITSNTESTNGWRNITVNLVGTVEGHSYLVTEQARQNLSSPVLMKEPSANGVGRISWLNDDEAGKPSAQEFLLVNPILGVVPPTVLEGALREEAVAIAETAVLLSTGAKGAARDDWATEVPVTNIRLIREWLTSSAALGSSFASSLLHKIGKDSDCSPVDVRDDSRLHPDTASYKAFTRLFDEEINALDLVDPQEADRLANTFDNLYQQACLGPALEESAPDLSGLLVTMLLDNSGSMRGNSISALAAIVRALAEILSRSGAAVEILGFTTKAWKGGRSREAWLNAGAPGKPGRLNDLRHIVYHRSGQPWDSVSWRPLSLMLKEGILKENIDGEALRWAYLRALQALASRKTIIVFSDGAPMDDSTLEQNHSKYLQRHLKSVAEAIEEQEQVSLVAVGFNHDPSPYYRRSTTIAGEISKETIESILSLLLSNPKKRKRAVRRRQRISKQVAPT